MLQRYKKNRTSASFLLTKCATFLIKCYWGTFSVPSVNSDPLLFMNKYKSGYLRLCSAFICIQKKRDCTVAVPLNEALALPSLPNKQHRVHADMYDYVHAQ